MMRIERMQEPLQLPRRLHFLGVRRIESLAAAPRGRPALAVAPVLDASPATSIHAIRTSSAAPSTQGQWW